MERETAKVGSKIADQWWCSGSGQAVPPLTPPPGGQEAAGAKCCCSSLLQLSLAAAPAQELSAASVCAGPTAVAATNLHSQNMAGAGH